MNNLTISLILILVLVVGFSGYKFSDMRNKLDSAEETAAREIALRKINVEKSMLSEESEFIFARISNQYTHYYDKEFTVVGIGVDTVKIIYEWEYEFSFGIQIPEDWDWCPKELTDKPGYVGINSPHPSFISSNPPSPREKDIINGSNSVNDQTRADEMADLSLQRINQDAEQYLEDNNVRKTINLAFSKHLQDVMNAGHPDSNPISGVVLSYVDEPTCI